MKKTLYGITLNYLVNDLKKNNPQNKEAKVKYSNDICLKSSEIFNEIFSKEQTFTRLIKPYIDNLDSVLINLDTEIVEPLEYFPFLGLTIINEQAFAEYIVTALIYRFSDIIDEYAYCSIPEITDLIKNNNLIEIL